MYNLNGKVTYDEIDFQTNSFTVPHEYGKLKSLSNTLTLERNGNIRSFRPASIIFRDGSVRVVIGSYRLSQGDIVHYSFGFFKTEEDKLYGYSEFSAKLRILSNTIFSAKMTIIGITPGDIVIESDIPFGEMQSNPTPRFWWDVPEDNGVPVTGYYYAINQYKSYFVSKKDQFTPLTSVKISFPSSGTYYFHVRAINEYGSMSRNTSTVEIRYNDPPTVPGDLRTNYDVVYSGPTSQNYLSWIASTNTDGDVINYEIEVLRNGVLATSGKINAYPMKTSKMSGMFTVSHDTELTVQGKMNVETDGTRSGFFGYFNISEADVVEYDKEDENLRYYIYPPGVFSGERTQEGNYSWRVRAYDWLEFSDWSEYSYFTIKNYGVSFSGRFVIPIYGIERGFRGQFFVKYTTMFFGSLYLFPGFTGKLSISTKEYGYFSSKLFIAAISGFYGKMNVMANFSTFHGYFRMIDVPGSSKMAGKLIVQYEEETYFHGKFTVNEYTSSSFSGKMNIHVEKKEYFSGKLEILRKNVVGKMTIIQTDTKNFLGKMTVRNAPPAPIISSNVGNDWQTNNMVTFTWVVVGSNIPVTGYGYYLSPDKLSSPNLSLFYNTALQERTENLEDIKGAREYYFYVFARGSNGSVSDVSEYIVRYNHVPTAPGTPMSINGEESVSGQPIIGKSFSNVFSWKKSLDEDSGDLLSYTIEISKNSDFSTILTTKSDITYNGTGDIVEFPFQYDFEDDYTGTYYWRVKCFDGHQYSPYSFTGRFKVNTPPGVPYNLEVLDGL